ncbi:hypothetical protein SVIOM342S_01122 [Streptomyces violaceorubidus]
MTDTTDNTGPLRDADAEPPAFPQEKAPGCPFDPPPGYRRFQAEDPFARVTLPSGQRARVVTRHRDVRAVLDDPRFSADSAHPDFPRMFPRPVPQVLKGTFPRSTAPSTCATAGCSPGTSPAAGRRNCGPGSSRSWTTAWT